MERVNATCGFSRGRNCYRDRILKSINPVSRIKEPIAIAIATAMNELINLRL
jgi:hypothetical protein